VALAVAVVAFLGTRPANDPRSLVLAQAPTPTPTPAAAVSRHVVTFPTIPRSRPVRLTIPTLSINIYVGMLGLQVDHQVMVPTSTHVVDWFDEGPTPGQVGSAVILGHVDSYLGPGTFFYLKLLKPGNAIFLELNDRTVERYVVTKVEQYSKSAFPDRLVYGSNGSRSLQLVTCGGTFNHDTGSYESNVVVFSHLVSVSLPHS
jgi:sortase (surface protein transpeptidase)